MSTEVTSIILFLIAAFSVGSMTTGVSIKGQPRTSEGLNAVIRYQTVGNIIRGIVAVVAIAGAVVLSIVSS